jgi:DNA-binding transcriptional regulator YdaS (Cro superfamily)
MRPTPIAQAIKRAGSVKALAKVAGVRPQAVSQWRDIPPGRVARISDALGMPRHELRPDLYEAPASEAAA